MSVQALLPFAWGTMMLLLGAGAILMSWLYRRLRDHHHEKWRDLGSPTLFLNASISNQRRVNRFIWKSEFQELGDPTLTSMARWAKRLGLATLVSFLATMGLIIAHLQS